MEFLRIDGVMAHRDPFRGHACLLEQRALRLSDRDDGVGLSKGVALESARQPGKAQSVIFPPCPGIGRIHFEDQHETEHPRRDQTGDVVQRITLIDEVIAAAAQPHEELPQ